MGQDQDMTKPTPIGYTTGIKNSRYQIYDLEMKYWNLLSNSSLTIPKRVS
jgi:hypothetical protein